MNAMRNVLVSALACALVSAAPSRSVQGDAAPATAQPAPKPGEPQWVESMQRLVKDLTDDNVKMRRQLKDLQDEREALKRALSDCEARLEKKQQENQGVLKFTPDLIVPPRSVPGSQVPPNWRPFEFNGATYYVIPCKDGKPQELQVAPQAPLIEPGKTLRLEQAPPAR